MLSEALVQGVVWTRRRRANDRSLITDSGEPVISFPSLLSSVQYCDMDYNDFDFSGVCVFIIICEKRRNTRQEEHCSTCTWLKPGLRTRLQQHRFLPLYEHRRDDSIRAYMKMLYYFNF